MKIFQKTYESGLRLVFQKVSKNRPASLMIAVDAGSKDETPDISGIAHFVEHMAFKGTKNLSAKDITVAFENAGINANAFTNQFHTCYYGTTLTEKIEEMFKIFSEIVFESTYEQAELDKERKVIFEEIGMNEDLPDRVAQNCFNRHFYAGTPIERTVLGNKNTLKRITCEDIEKFVKKHYIAPKIVVSVCGDLSEKMVDDLTQKYVNVYFEDAAEVVEKDEETVILPKKTFSFMEREGAQTHVILGFPTGNIYAKDHYANLVSSFVFGGGSSSRLFQKIREDKGLVYSISCHNERHEFGGENHIAFATNEKNVKLAVKTVKKEIENFLKTGVSEEEFVRTKTLLKSLILSSNEKAFNFVHRNATSLLTFGKIITAEHRLKKIENLKLEKVNEVMRKTFDFSHMVACVVGKNIDSSLFEVFN